MDTKRIHRACITGDTEELRKLIRAGGNVNFRSGNQMLTPLHIAALESRLECAKILIENGADVDIAAGVANKNSRGTALILAAAAGNFDIVELLVTNQAKLDLTSADGTTALMAASLGGHLDTVEYLIIQGAHINACRLSGVTSLHCACQNGHFTTVQALVSNGADLDVCCELGTPLCIAVRFQHRDIVHFLLEKKADPNIKTIRAATTTLHIAAVTGNHMILKTLLNNGANIESRDEYKDTPLHDAANRNSYEALRVLLENGADIHAVNKYGKTALHLAAGKGSESCTRYLIEKGANPNAESEDKTTPLMSAALRGRVKAGQVLTEAGADLDATENKGFTALHCASQNGHVEFVKLLLQKGADPKIRSTSNITAFHKAVAGGHSDVISVLLAHNTGLCSSVDKITDRTEADKRYVPSSSISKTEKSHTPHPKILNSDLGKSSMYHFDKILRSHHGNTNPDDHTSVEITLPDVTPTVASPGVVTSYEDSSVHVTPGARLLSVASPGVVTSYEDSSVHVTPGALLLSVASSELEKAFQDHSERMETELDMTEMEHSLKEMKVVDGNCSLLSARSMLDSLAAGSRSDWAEVLMSLLKSKPHYADLTDTISKDLPK